MKYILRSRVLLIADVVKIIASKEKNKNFKKTLCAIHDDLYDLPIHEDGKYLRRKK